MMRCINCGFENSDDSKFCGKCGSSLEPENKKIEEYFSHINDDFYEEFRTDNNKDGITAKDNSSFENIEQNEREFFNEEDSSDEEDSFLEKIKEHKKKIKKNKTQSKHKEKISEINKTSIIKDKRKLIIITAVIMVILVSFVGYNLFVLNEETKQIKKSLDIVFLKDDDEMFAEYAKEISSDNLSSASTEKTVYYDNFKEIHNDFYEKVTKQLATHVAYTVPKEAPLQKDIFINSMKNIDYEIEDINGSGDSVKVKIKFFMPDYGKIFEDAYYKGFSSWASGAGSYFTNIETSSFFLMASVMTSYSEVLEKNYSKDETLEATLDLKKENDSYVLVNTKELTTPLFNKMQEDIFASISELSI